MIFLILLFIFGSDTSTDEQNTLINDFNKYQSTYYEDLIKLGDLEDQWNKNKDESDSYTSQGFITKLADTGNEYADTYEYYLQHQQDYSNFLDTNKQQLELLEISSGKVSVIDIKKEIGDNKIRIQQNIRMMQTSIQQAIEISQAQEESKNLDLSSLVQLGIKLIGLL